MRVECMVNEREGRIYQITVGETYWVVEVQMSPEAEETSHPTVFRLSADDGDVPGLYDADLFVLVDGRLPSQWVFTPGPHGESYVIGPEAWSTPGFWEDYFDGSTSARNAFDAELQRMTEEIS